MKISLDWISDFVDLDGVDVRELADLVTERIAEVEDVISTGCQIPKVVVGRIEKIEPVEGADKIQLTTTNVGGESLSIVCGAKNIFEGAIVPVAVVGAELPGGFKIEKRKLKGVESCGMICSESELGLAEKSDGIWLLGDEFADKIGEELKDVLPTDTILDIDNHSLTHRPDLFGHVGFAREIAAVLGREFRTPEIQTPEFDGKLKVEVRDEKACPRYSGLSVENLKVAPSPERIRRRLAACGVRSINNLVDATNFVMLELGQPMHAFDARQISDGIVVRLAESGEEFTTLDGEKRRLTSEMLVIADGEKAVGLAGVMGGENSEVADDTTALVLEAANFDAVTIRKAVIGLGLRSDASTRFEKHLDPTLTPAAIARCVQILRETCPDLQLGAGADVANFSREKVSIELPRKRITEKLGTEIADEKVEEILTRLEFGVAKNDDGWTVEVPTFRAGRDVSMTDDLIEEVARVFGFNSLPTEFPRVQIGSPRLDDSREFAATIRERMIGFGFAETLTLSLVSKNLLEKVGEKIEKSASLTNPPSDDFRFLRQSLTPSLLVAAETNAKNFDDFQLFEISTVFDATAAETRKFAAVVVGENAFDRVRGVLNSLAEIFKFDLKIQPTENSTPLAHPGRVGEVFVGEKSVGFAAELHPRVAKSFDLKTAAFFELDFETLAAIPRPTVVARDLPIFPAVPRDASFVFDERTLAVDVETAIRAADPRVVSVRLFDEFRGEEIDSDKKSLAFALSFRDESKTLTDEESEEIFEKVVAAVEAIGGKLRG